MENGAIMSKAINYPFVRKWREKRGFDDGHWYDDHVSELLSELKHSYADMLTALRVLTRLMTHGDKTGNPYGKPEVKRALQAIAKARGKRGDWMDANDGGKVSPWYWDSKRGWTLLEETERL